MYLLRPYVVTTTLIMACCFFEMIPLLEPRSRIRFRCETIVYLYIKFTSFLITDIFAMGNDGIDTFISSYLRINSVYKR